MTDEQRLIGKLEAKVENLERTVESIDSKLDKITSLVEQGKGAKWAIGALATVFGGAGGALAAMLGRQ